MNKIQRVASLASQITAPTEPTPRLTRVATGPGGCPLGSWRLTVERDVNPTVGADFALLGVHR